MRAMILAAGRGERLKPLSDVLPKPSVPVCNRPAIWYALDCLYQQGFRQVVINTFHLGDSIAQSLAPWTPSDMRVTYLREKTLLGTAGGLSNAKSALESDKGATIVVFNGKVVFFPDLSDALAEHHARRAFATMIIRPYPVASGYGLVEVDRDGNVCRILGHPATDRVETTPYMFTGVHILNSEAVKSLPDKGCVIRSGYLSWLSSGKHIHGYVTHAPWYEVSTIEGYYDANMALLSRHIAWPKREIYDPCLAATAHVHADAKLTRCVIGERAHVAKVALENCVVWPDVRVSHSVSDAILTPTAILRLSNVSPPR
ncbi:MAG: NDP-sugar synthase [Myxococcales bacterium]|nr:NDP-sugar synthase [Myxococcales bacterium]MCB9708657.1 NDP-sugar synthase [Myxococcales bacterium]